MKKLAGQDIEDILQVHALPWQQLYSAVRCNIPLQCWIPVIEGILPEEGNKILLDLAFDMATWHAYTKLRVHTTHTIRSLQSQTKELGTLLRRYAKKVCPKYKTKPLPGEAAAAYRRKAAKGKKTTKGKEATSAPEPANAPNAHEGPGYKWFNLKTYKIHALGDYADHIEQFGPTNCFLTQQVCPYTTALSSRPHCRCLLDRVNLSTSGSRSSTSVRTRCDLNVRSQSRSGWNVTIASTSTR